MVGPLTDSKFIRIMSLVAAAGVACPALAQLEGDDEILREGTSERRELLDEMELTPFALENWELVSDWRLADAPTVESMDGKVILIMTFAGWYPPSLRSLGVMNRLAQDHAEDGLVVLGVHDMEAWEEGASAAADRGVTFPIGHDAENLFREALLVDQDPDFYLIDRAGQMRFADIETSSIEAAVELLLDEDREDAATLVDRIADARRRAEIEARRTRLINQEADLTDIPPVPFVMPGPDVFAMQRWPAAPRDPNNPTAPSTEASARTLTLPADGWHPSAPLPGNGRVTVVYFFDQRVPATTALIEDMDALQRRYSRSVQVVGVMTPIFQDQSGQLNTQGVAGNPGELVSLLRRTHERAGLAHSLVADPGATIMGAVSGGQGFQQGATGGSRTRAAVVSSDGVVRWFGDATSTNFESAVDTVARVDPGVRARREAEDEYLRRNPR